MLNSNTLEKPETVEEKHVLIIGGSEGISLGLAYFCVHLRAIVSIVAHTW